jgi:hypothetical protein
MFSLLAVSLFAVTGVMLNHPGWFGLQDPHVTTVQGTIDAAAAKSGEKDAVVQALRSRLGLSGAVESYDPEEKEILVVCGQPGQECRATVSREDGATEVVITSRGLAGLLCDLHKGDSSGVGWKIFIDLTAGMLVLSALTGIVVWLATPRRRMWGGVALLVGAGLWTAAYFVLAAR